MAINKKTGYKKTLIPIHLRRAILFRDKNTCQCCGKKGNPGHFKDRVNEIIYGKEIAFEIDHIVPEYLGGKTVLDNLLLSCRNCNRAKGHKHG